MELSIASPSSLVERVLAARLQHTLDATTARAAAAAAGAGVGVSCAAHSSLHMSARDPLSARVRVRSPSKSARYAGKASASGAAAPGAAASSSSSVHSLSLVRASPVPALPSAHRLPYSTGGALPTFAALLLHPSTHPALQAVRSGSLQRQQAGAQLATAAAVYGPLAAAAGLPGRPWLQQSRPVSSLSEPELRALRRSIFLHADVQLLLLLFWQLAVPKRRADSMLSFAGYKSIFMRVQKRLLGPAYRAKDVAARCEEHWARDWGGLYPGASREFSVVQGLPVQHFISSLFEQIDAYISGSSSAGAGGGEGISAGVGKGSGASGPIAPVSRGQGPAMLSVPLGHNAVTIPLPCPERYVAALERILMQITWRGEGAADGDGASAAAAAAEHAGRALPGPGAPSSQAGVLHSFRLRELPQVGTGDFDAPDSDADAQACRSYTLSAVYSLLQHPESVYQRQLRQQSASSSSSFSAQQRPVSPPSPPAETSGNDNGEEGVRVPIAALHQPLPSASASVGGGNLRPSPRPAPVPARGPPSPPQHSKRPVALRTDSNVDAHDDPQAVAEHPSDAQSARQEQKKEPAASGGLSSSSSSSTPAGSRSASPSKQVSQGAARGVAGRVARSQHARSPGGGVAAGAGAPLSLSLRITGSGSSSTSASASAPVSAQASPLAHGGADAVAGWDHRTDSGDEDEVDRANRVVVSVSHAVADAPLAAPSAPASPAAATQGAAAHSSHLTATVHSNSHSTLSIASPSEKRQSKRKSVGVITGGVSPRRTPAAAAGGATLDRSPTHHPDHSVSPSPRVVAGRSFVLQGRSRASVAGAAAAAAATTATTATAAAVVSPASPAAPSNVPNASAAANTSTTNDASIAPPAAALSSSPSSGAAAAASAPAATPSPVPSSSPSGSPRSSMIASTSRSRLGGLSMQPARPRFQSLVSMALAASRAAPSAGGGGNAMRRSQSKKSVGNGSSSSSAVEDEPVPSLKVVDHTNSLLASLRSLVNLGAKSISAHLDALKRREEQAATGTVTVATPSVAHSAAASVAPSAAPSAPSSDAGSAASSRDSSRTTSPLPTTTTSSSPPSHRSSSASLATDGGGGAATASSSPVSPAPLVGSVAPAKEVSFDLHDEDDEEVETEGTENREEETDVCASEAQGAGGPDAVGACPSSPDSADVATAGPALGASASTPTLSAEAEVDALFGLVASAHEARKTTKSGVTILIEQAQKLHAASNMQLDQLPQFIVDAAAEASETPAQRRARLAAQAAAAAAAAAAASRSRAWAITPSKPRSTSPKKLRASQKQTKMALAATATNASPNTAAPVAAAEPGAVPTVLLSPSPPSETSEASTEPVSTEPVSAPVAPASEQASASSIPADASNAAVPPATESAPSDDPSAAPTAAPAELPPPPDESDAATAATVTISVTPAEQPDALAASGVTEPTSVDSAPVASRLASTESRTVLSRTQSTASTLAAAAAAHQSLQDASAVSRTNWQQAQLLQAKNSRDEAREEARIEAELAAQLRRIKTKELRLAEARARENRHRAQATRVSMSQQEGEEVRRQLASERTMREAQHAQEVAIKRAAVKAPRILVSAGASPALMAAAAGALTIATAEALAPLGHVMGEGGAPAPVAEAEHDPSSSSSLSSSRSGSRVGSGSRSRERLTPGSPRATALVPSQQQQQQHAVPSLAPSHARKGSSVLGGGGSGRGHKRFATAFEELLSSINDVEPMTTAVAAATRSGLTTLLPSIGGNDGSAGEELFAHLEMIAEPIVTARAPPVEEESESEHASASPSAEDATPRSAYAAAERAVLRREAGKARARDDEARRVAVYAELALKRGEAANRRKRKTNTEAQVAAVPGAHSEPAPALSQVVPVAASSPPRISMAAMVADAFAGVALEESNKSAPKRNSKPPVVTEQKEVQQPSEETHPAAHAVSLAILPSAPLSHPSVGLGPASSLSWKHPRAAAPSVRKSNAPMRTSYHLVQFAHDGSPPPPHSTDAPLVCAQPTQEEKAAPPSPPAGKAETVPLAQVPHVQDPLPLEPVPVASKKKKKKKRRNQEDTVESEQPPAAVDGDNGNDNANADADVAADADAVIGAVIGAVESESDPPVAAEEAGSSAQQSSWRTLEDALAHSRSPGEVLDLQRLIHALRSSTHGSRGAVLDPSSHGMAARIHPHLYSSKFALPARRLIDRWLKQPGEATAQGHARGRRGRARQAQEAANALATEDGAERAEPAASSDPSTPRTLSPLRVAAAAGASAPPSPRRAAAAASISTVLPHAHRLHLPAGSMPLKEPNKRPFALAALGGGGGGHSSSLQLLPTQAALIARSQTVFSTQVLPLAAPLVPPLPLSVSASTSALPSAFPPRHAQTDRRPAAPPVASALTGSQSSRAHRHRAAAPAPHLSSSLCRPPATQVDMRTLAHLRPPVYAPPFRLAGGVAGIVGAPTGDPSLLPSRIQKELYAFMTREPLDSLPCSLPPVNHPATTARDSALLGQLSLHLERQRAPRLVLRPEDAFDPVGGGGGVLGALARHIDLASSARREVFRSSKRFEPASDNVATPATEAAYAHVAAQELRARIALARGEVHASTHAHANGDASADGSWNRHYAEEDSRVNADPPRSPASSSPSAQSRSSPIAVLGSDDEREQHGGGADLTSKDGEQAHAAASAALDGTASPRSHSSSRRPSARARRASSGAGSPRRSAPARTVAGGAVTAAAAVATAAPSAASPPLQSRSRPQSKEHSSKPTGSNRASLGSRSPPQRRRTSSSPTVRAGGEAHVPAPGPASADRNSLKRQRSGSASKQPSQPSPGSIPAAPAVASTSSASSIRGAATVASPSLPSSPSLSPSSSPGHSRRLSSLKGSRPVSREALTVSFATHAQGESL